MDESLLPVAAELEKVKVFRPLPAGSQRASQKIGKFREKTGNAVHLDDALGLPEEANSQRESLVLANGGAPWPETEDGGGGGIRTHGTLSGTPDFESGTIDHSATPPDQGAKT